MISDKLWSALFACATAVLMLGIMLLRTAPPPTWALLIFPAVGALLAHAASRTTENRQHIMWLETSTIAAACVVVLMLMINGFLIELFVGSVSTSAEAIRQPAGVLLFFVLAGGSVLLWWALERRLSRMRKAGRTRLQSSEPDKAAKPKPVVDRVEKQETDKAA